ncbi:tyrosine-type recombinase/integrase [Streptomyces sp. WZ-12]|uniref:tyrosine-type recombinase/integrase n=1 Tax=Streptomyces sp. WZ-12 TaxID=3030210 RepID=UPI0023810800|nr:tyrosine-type recombinase/integrase [Streptomyces sp. WZ-12]
MPAVAYPDADKAKEDWLESLRGRTRTEYERDVRRYFEHCERRETNPLDARQIDVDSYATWLTEHGVGPAAWNRARAAVKSFYNYAARETERCQRNPAEGTQRATVSSKKSLGLTKEQAEVLLTEAYYSGPRLYALVLLLLETGLRVSEVVEADVADLGTVLNQPVLTTIVKGEDTPVDTPLNRRVYSALLRTVDGRTSGALFVTRTGKRLTRQGAYDTIVRLARRAFSRHMHPHDLRATFITLALEMGIPLDFVQEAVHHKDPRTTKDYDSRRRALSSSPTHALGAHLAHPDKDEEADHESAFDAAAASPTARTAASSVLPPELAEARDLLERIYPLLKMRFDGQVKEIVEELTT